ncbi:MAG TPA: hypothetical protein VFV50_11605 [Bdellovibrionales bacterium]|nr:hypothetical protein [Bdellovibrionales bacterium]
MSADADGDGVRDWTIFDGDRVADALIPADDDLDGDGVENIWDERPLVRSRKPRANELPAHLISKRAKAAQRSLYEKFQILAIDHTDMHAPKVLEELTSILEDARARGVFRRPGNWKYLYAFAGHDDRHNQGAFHPRLEAISVGGELTYSDVKDRRRLRETLLHEIGHAVFFDQMRDDEIEGLNRLAGWPLGEGPRLRDSLMKPFKGADTDGAVISKYSRRNFHEWFAESFASYVLMGVRPPRAKVRRPVLVHAHADEAPASGGGRRDFLRPLRDPVFAWFKQKFGGPF